MSECILELVSSCNHTKYKWCATQISIDGRFEKNKETSEINQRRMLVFRIVFQVT